MVIFKAVRFKNFLSSGNIFTEINLAGSKKTLIIGKNGSGKCLERSTEIDVLINNPQVQSAFEEYLHGKKNR